MSSPPLAQSSTHPGQSVDEEKGSFSQTEERHPHHHGHDNPHHHGHNADVVDEAAKVLATITEKPPLTAEEDRRVLRRVDLAVLPVLLLVYFLQQLDKSSLSYTGVFNISGEAHLVGTQYSWLGSVVYVAQLVFQPLSAYALIHFPVGKWVRPFLSRYCDP